MYKYEYNYMNICRYKNYLYVCNYRSIYLNKCMYICVIRSIYLYNT